MRRLTKIAVASFILLSSIMPATGVQPVQVSASDAYGCASTLSRPEDPVILTGADVPSLKGIKPEELVAWKYSNGWEQIPVQVDEKDILEFKKIYNANKYLDVLFRLAGRKSVSMLSYTDSNTFAGADKNPLVDDNDEIVFMAKDTGGVPDAFAEPAGVIKDTGVRIRITDPNDSKAEGYVYLFKQDGTLSQSAGEKYVDYSFKLLSGDYMKTYKTAGGPNPEDSKISTPYYSRHFSDRWIDDELHIYAGTATGVDILDRHKALFTPGNPARSEDTFSKGAKDGFPGEGCFVVNKSGPVRAIRSYLGANSGFFTQREHVFYESRQDITTFVRVHAIIGVLDFFDYSPEAGGMTYYNDLNKSGVIIDGVEDNVVKGKIKWEMVNGSQGALSITHKINTDIPELTHTSYYLDSITPVDMQCTGDAYAYGSSGIRIARKIPNTDPSMDEAKMLEIKKYLYYKAPGLTVKDAEKLSSNAVAPLEYKVESAGS